MDLEVAKMLEKYSKRNLRNISNSIEFIIKDYLLKENGVKDKNDEIKTTKKNKKNTDKEKNTEEDNLILSKNREQVKNLESEINKIRDSLPVEKFVEVLKKTPIFDSTEEGQIKNLTAILSELRKIQKETSRKLLTENKEDAEFNNAILEAIDEAF